MNVVYIMFFNV